MIPFNKFAAQMTHMCVTEGLPPPLFDGERCIFQSSWRPILALFQPQCEDVVFSSVVFLKDRDSNDLIDAREIAAFNAWRLLEDGGRLAFDPSTTCLYMTKRTSLAWISSRGLAPFLKQFVDECRLCTIWLCQMSNDASPMLDDQCNRPVSGALHPQAEGANL